MGKITSLKLQFFIGHDFILFNLSYYQKEMFIHLTFFPYQHTSSQNTFLNPRPPFYVALEDVL